MQGKEKQSRGDRICFGYFVQRVAGLELRLEIAKKKEPSFDGSE
jgi:hypothetical protein